jgi:hypothetical protein
MVDEARYLDHAVIAVEDLGAAEALFRKLGFTTAPVGVHPFGTHNVNIYLGNCFMIELLAVRDLATYREANACQNTFTVNDAAFRQSHHRPGISHVVVTTDDAAADHARFEREGVLGGPIVEFTRDFLDPAGAQSTVSVCLVFATPQAAKDVFWFTCENVESPALDNKALLKHRNGVTGIRAVIGMSDEPESQHAFLETVCQSKVNQTEGSGLEIAFPNGYYRLCRPSEVSAEFGLTTLDSDTNDNHLGLVLNVDDIDQTGAYLRDAQVAFTKHANRLVLKPFGGSYPILVFENE